MKKYDVIGKSRNGQPVKAAHGPMTEKMANIVAEAMMGAGYTDVRTIVYSTEVCANCSKEFGPDDMIFAVYGMLFCNSVCATEAIESGGEWVLASDIGVK